MHHPKAGQRSLSVLTEPRPRTPESRAFIPSSAPRLTPEALRKLTAEWSITTVEELYSWARVTDRARVRQSLGKGLIAGAHHDLAESLEPFIAPETLRQFGEVSRFKYSFGAHLEAPRGFQPNQPSALRETGSTDFERNISLIDNCMPPIRSQGPRPTSVAFATCAVMEYAFCRERGQALDLSEQWQYWNCKRCDGNPAAEGTSPRWSFYLAARDGVCEEQHWPYNLIDDPANASPNPPPPAAINAPKHKLARFTDVPTPRDIAVLKGFIARGKPVAFAIPMFASVDEDVNTRLTGNLLVPAETEMPLDMGHAMVLVGYEDHAGFAGGGYFIVRNSWGDRWGIQCPFGAGYGTIPYLFIERYNHCALAGEL